jgi:FixJ family two-component response regulator
VRSLSTVIETARLTWREPVEIMAAIGHGRSYGQNSVVFGRKISGIFPCALWQDLQNRPSLPTAALINLMRKRGLELPIVIITGYPDSDMLDRILTKGPITVLKKPLQVEQLQQTVRILGHKDAVKLAA